MECASRAYLACLEKAQREARDIEIINRNAQRLNAEALDVLGYQRVHEPRRDLSRRQVREKRS
jgi:hypothetical protein